MAELSTFLLSELLADDGQAKLTRALTAKAKVVVTCRAEDRLPTNFLATVLAVATATQGFLRFDGLSTLAQTALGILDPDRRIAVSGSTIRSASSVGDRPFQVSIAADGQLSILLIKGVGQHLHMNETISHEWIRGLEVSAVNIDLSQVDHLNSLLVAWLLQINQGAGKDRCRLINVGRQAVAQLTQLRLNHLLNIV
jgi:anti-anti-sigma regulatory factor